MTTEDIANKMTCRSNLLLIAEHVTVTYDRISPETAAETDWTAMSDTQRGESILTMLGVIDRFVRLKTNG